MIPDTWQADGSLATSGRADRRRTPGRSCWRTSPSGPAATAAPSTPTPPCSTRPPPIRDHDGEYEEVIDPAAFNRAIDHAARSGHKIPVMFNHGKTMYGTPSELDTMPIGVTEEIKADRRGLFTRARYHRSARADSILESIREGSIAVVLVPGGVQTVRAGRAAWRVPSHRDGAADGAADRVDAAGVRAYPVPGV